MVGLMYFNQYKRVCWNICVREFGANTNHFIKLIV